MAIRRFSTAEPGVKSNKFWDQDTAQGAMEPIISVTGTAKSGGEDIVIANIPQTYQDLMIVGTGKVTVGSGGVQPLAFQLNGITSGYSTTLLTGNGSSTGSSRITAQPAIYPLSNLTYLSPDFPTNISVNILNYRSSASKTVLSRVGSDRNGSGITSLGVTLSPNTSAITSLAISTGWAGWYWTGDSTFTLYGIKAGA